MTLIKWNELVLPEEYELAKSRSETYKDSLIDRCIENGDQVKAETPKTIIGGHMSRPWFCAVYRLGRSPPHLLANFLQIN